MSKTENKVSYHIKTAKTKKFKDGRVLDLAYKRVTQRADNGRISIKNITETGEEFVHPDLINSLKAFLPHFLLLGERANINDFQPSYFKKKEYNTKKYDYEVTGIHIKESHEKMFVIMVGRQILKSGRVISMVIPMVCFEPDEDDEDVYPFHEELKIAVDGYLSEVEQHMNGKVGESDQTEMDLPEPEQEPDNVKSLKSKTA